MIQLLERAQIKHADWPVLLTLFIPVLLLSVAALIWIASLTAVILLILFTQLSTLIYQTHLYNRIRQNLRDQQQKSQAYSMLLNILKPERPLPFMTDWAATPELALKITETIQRHHPNRMLELGRGISTVISAMTVTKTGSGEATGLALDHDPPYADHSSEPRHTQGLDNVATIRHTPLNPATLKRRRWHWQPR